MPPHNIHLDIENTVLKNLISEQLVILKHLISDNGSAPDCIITQAATNGASQSKPVFLLLPEKGTIRLGEILDKLSYLLSGREDHVEDDSQHIDLGKFILRPSENILLHKKSDKIIQLTDKERMLLRYLYQSGAEGILRKDLLKSVWGYAEEAETHTLETHIYRLRQKLESFGAEDMIKVHDGRYRIVV